MDATRSDELAGRTRALLILIGDRLRRSDAELFAEFIDHGEYGLAVEQTASALSEASALVTADERAVINELSDTMGGLALPAEFA